MKCSPPFSLPFLSHPTPPPPPHPLQQLSPFLVFIFSETHINFQQCSILTLETFTKCGYDIVQVDGGRQNTDLFMNQLSVLVSYQTILRKHIVIQARHWKEESNWTQTN